MGGLAWPILNGLPGCAVIVGSTRGENPNFEVLEASFDNSPRALLKSCYELRDKYGFKEAPKILNHWAGENLFKNILLDLYKKKTRGLFISPPPDFDKPNSDQIYIEQIRSLADEGRLKIHDQVVLNELKSLTVFDAENRLSSFPAVAAVSYVLHESIVFKPWISRTTVVDLDDDGVGSETIILDDY